MADIGAFSDPGCKCWKVAVNYSCPPAVDCIGRASVPHAITTTNMYVRTRERDSFPNLHVCEDEGSN